MGHTHRYHIGFKKKKNQVKSPSPESRTPNSVWILQSGRTGNQGVIESLNAARAINPQWIFAQTNPLTQPRAYERGFSFNGGHEGIMQPSARVNGNRGQQVQQVPQ